MNRVFCIFLILLVAGCSAGYHKDQVRDTDGDRLTVGTVQKEILVGMSAAEVASAMGSPNIVTTDEKRREVWIYDKISTEVAYSKSSSGIASLLVGVWGDGGAGGGAGFSGNTGAAAQSQRTLTVIIKFNEMKKVRDFAYHTSRF